MIRVAVLCIGLAAATVGLAESPPTSAPSTRFIFEAEAGPRVFEAWPTTAPTTGPTSRRFAGGRIGPWNPFPDLATYAATVDAAMKFSLPPGAVAFTQDAQEGDALRQRSPKGEYDFVGSGVGHMPPPWAALNPTPPMSGISRLSGYGGVVFLHARKTNAGRELLMLVHWSRDGDAGLRVTLVELDPNDPAKRREASVLAIPRGVLLAAPDPQPGLDIEQRLRFSAGQPNPHDASALTIDYAMATNQRAKYRPGSIWIRLTDEPELAKYEWPKRPAGTIPMLIEVTRPDGTIWIKK